MTGRDITKMVLYYSDLYDEGTGVGSWTVKIGETTATSLSSLDNTTTLTQVFSGGLDALFNTTDKTLTITFDDSYTYQGGNLLVEFSHTADQNYWRHCFFYGESVNGASFCYGLQRDFMPKTSFTFAPASSCGKPTDFSLNYNQDTKTATLTWTGEASSYNVKVNGTVTNGVTSPYTIPNIQYNTTYTVKLQSDCGNEQSGWVNTGSFTTPCPESYDIPYAYGFEDEVPLNCWTIHTTGKFSHDTDISNFFPRTGNNSFMLKYTEQPSQYLISPQLSGIINGLHVEFWYRQYTNGVETFQVGYSTTDNDPENFTWGDVITANTSYQRFSANYPANTKYVAVKHLSDDQYYLFLDDFLFEESASVLEPTGVTVSNATTTGFTVSWTAGADETAWDIYVSDDESDIPDESTTPSVENVTNKPYTLTNLSSCTTYYVYVRANKGTEKSVWSSPGVINTKCLPISLPYNYDFENDQQPISWNTIVENTSYNGVNVMTASETGTNHFLAFFMGSSQNSALIAVLPEFDQKYQNDYQVTFDACYTPRNSSMDSGKIAIGIMTDPTDASTFESVKEVDITSALPTFNSYTLFLYNYTSTGHYIAIKDIFTQNGYVIVDNVSVTELPAILLPTDINVTGTKNAVVTWEGNATSYDVALATSEVDDPENYIIGNTEENVFDLSSFTNVGDNFLWIRSNYGDNEHSEWVSTSFSVNYCLPDPASHDGKGITGISFGTGDYVVTNGDGSASLPASAPYFGDYTSMVGAVQAGVESPIAITTETASNTFDYPYTFVIWVDLDKSMSFEDSEILYIGKAPQGTGTFNATITIPLTQALGDYRMRIYGADSYFNAFYNNGQTKWTAEHDPCNSGTYRHAHDYTLRVLAPPSCLPASNVTVSPNNITSTSAVITWTNNNGADATYTVKQGETVLTTSAVDSYTITGLNVATYYPAGTFTVISNCDENLVINVPTFTTPCEDVTVIPWSEDFEGFEANTLLPCWDNNASTSTASSSYYIWGVFNYSNNNMIRMCNYWASTGTALINTPRIVLPAKETCQLSFDYSNIADCGDLKVNVSENGGLTWTELGLYPYIEGSTISYLTPGDFTRATISLADYKGKAIILQFFANANYNSGAIYVDNVLIDKMAQDITLIDDNSNENIINENNGVFANVTLSGRTLYKDGDWNTLCLPFAVTDGDATDDITFTGTPLAGATAKALDGTTSGFEASTGTLTLNFTDATSIEAGTPYIIRWTRASDYVDDTEHNITDPTFDGVTIDKSMHPVSSIDGKVTFKGTYEYSCYFKEDMSVLFLGSNNTLYYPLATATIGAQRAYFQLNGITVDDASGVRAFNLSFGGDGEATGIISVSNGAGSEGVAKGWYTLDGRRLNGKPTQRGIYINNGIKGVIK